MKMNNYEIPLLPGACYHIYNHANGFDNLFKNEGNYHYFLKKYAKYIAPIADTFAYCLMPNHIHFLIRIKAAPFLPQSFFQTSEGINTTTLSISRKFGSLFNGYAQAFNKQQGRKGSLFVPNFKRKLVEHPTYFARLIYYIHYNAVEAGLVAHPSLWPHSSFMPLLSDKPSRLCRDEVFSFFGGREAFLDAHAIRPHDSILKMALDWN